jgi:plastocyanin
MRAVVALVVAASFALVACSSTEPSGSAEVPFDVPGSPVATDRVDLPPSYRFSPAVITIAAGTTVTWTNDDNFPHNVHLLDGSEATEDLPIGESASITFAEPGIVYYECSIHPQQMRGKVIVEE